MRVRRKERCLLPSGCNADLTQRPVSSSLRPSWVLLQTIQLPALIEAVDQHSKEPIFPVLIGGAKSVPRLVKAEVPNPTFGEQAVAPHCAPIMEFARTALLRRKRKFAAAGDFREVPHKPTCREHS